jgi:hypothetical protein
MRVNGRIGRRVDCTLGVLLDHGARKIVQTKICLQVAADNVRGSVPFRVHVYGDCMRVILHEKKI